MADASTGSGRPDREKAAASPPAKKSTAKKATAKKATAKKTTAKKATAKKATAKKATAKKATAKKATAKKATAKKATAKKAAPPDPAPPAAAAPPVRPPEAPPGDAAAPPVESDEALRFPPDPTVVERPWTDSYPPLVPQTYPYPDVALTRLLDDAAKDFPDSIATEFAGRTLTYRRLLDQVDRFASALQTLGLSKGDRVGLAMPNCPQHVIAFYAVLRIGAIVVEHDPGADEDVLSYEIDTAGCKALVVADPVYAKVANLKGRLRTVEHVIATAVGEYMPQLVGLAFGVRHRRNPEVVFRIPEGEGVLRFVELVRRHPPTATQVPVEPATDTAVVAFEQDTRQRRAVMLSHRNLLANVFQVRLWVPDMQAGRETLLCAVPFWEPFGITTGISLGALSAATMSLTFRFDRDEVLGTIAKRKPTIFPASSTMVEALSAAPQLRKADLSSLRAVLCHGAVLQADVAKTFEDASGGRVREMLALLQASGVTHANPIYGKVKAERVGLPLTDTVCVVVGRDGRVLEQGRAGELVIHGPQVMQGYWQRPEDTAAEVVDGWLRTGLLAEIDDEGYVAMLGRVRAG